MWRLNTSTRIRNILVVLGNPNAWKILEWEEKLQTNKTNITFPKVSLPAL